MSYSINVTVEDGTPTVGTTYGVLPEGVFVISGHEGQEGASLSVTRYRPGNGGTVGYAHSYQTHLQPETPADNEAAG